MSQHNIISAWCRPNQHTFCLEKQLKGTLMLRQLKVVQYRHSLNGRLRAILWIDIYSHCSSHAVWVIGYGVRQSDFLDSYKVIIIIIICYYNSYILSRTEFPFVSLLDTKEPTTTRNNNPIQFLFYKFLSTFVTPRQQMRCKIRVSV